MEGPQLTLTTKPYTLGWTPEYTCARVEGSATLSTKPYNLG